MLYLYLGCIFMKILSPVEKGTVLAHFAYIFMCAEYIILHLCANSVISVIHSDLLFHGKALWDSDAVRCYWNIDDCYYRLARKTKERKERSFCDQSSVLSFQFTAAIKMWNLFFLLFLKQSLIQFGAFFFASLSHSWSYCRHTALGQPSLKGDNLFPPQAKTFVHFGIFSAVALSEVCETPYNDSLYQALRVYVLFGDLGPFWRKVREKWSNVTPVPFWTRVSWVCHPCPSLQHLLSVCIHKPFQMQNFAWTWWFAPFFSSFVVVVVIHVCFLFVLFLR